MKKLGKLKLSAKKMLNQNDLLNFRGGSGSLGCGVDPELPLCCFSCFANCQEACVVNSSCYAACTESCFEICPDL